MVAHEHKAFGVEQWPEADGLADLRRLVHDAEVELAAGKDGVFYPHAGRRHHELQHRDNCERGCFNFNIFLQEVQI